MSFKKMLVTCNFERLGYIVMLFSSPLPPRCKIRLYSFAGPCDVKFKYFLNKSEDFFGKGECFVNKRLDFA